MDTTIEDEDSSTDINGNHKIYKRYKYPDGGVLCLTKEEFLAVVDIFRMLLKQDRKDEAKAKLAGESSKAQLESPSSEKDCSNQESSE